MKKKYNTPHRYHVVKTRMTEEEYADFTERLKHYDMSQAEFIRQAITRATIRPIVTVLVIIAIALVAAFLLNVVSSCSMMVEGLGVGLASSSYASQDDAMLGAEETYSQMEAALQQKLDRFQQDHDYDEYHFDLDEIGHDPYVLISILSAMYPEGWTLAQIIPTLNTLFEKQYTLTVDVETELRYRDDGNGGVERYPYTICHTRLHYVVEFDVKGFFDNVDHSKLIKQIWSLGIRDKNLLFALKRILKAPIRLENGAMEYPTKGTPQGGIISLLLANIVLNELDQWVDSQWQDNPVTAKYKTSINANGSINKSNAYKFMRRTNLKEMYIVRYADDFRIFCRTKDEAERTMKAVTQWLMERLHLEVSPTKTKIVNVKHRYSEFLGFKMKVFRRADKYVIKSHVGDKQLEHARQKLVTQAKNIIHPRKEKHERGEISLYNSIVVGLQDYYRIATCISEDCSSLGRSVMTVLTNGLKERQGSRLVRNGRKLTVFESQKYGKSKSLRYVKGTDEPVYPISYIRHSIPLSRKRATNCYTPAGRKGLHDNLKINVNLMLALMRQPIGNRSVELADNRISLFSAQYGKCAVTGMPFLTTDEIHCHHIKPKKYGGNDSYENLVLINKLVHRLVHAETVETITYYLEVCNLNKKQMEKLNALRLKAGLGEIRGTQPLKTNKVDCNRL